MRISDATRRLCSYCLPSPQNHISSPSPVRPSASLQVARRVGVSVAQLIRDIQEKYNQFVIFYQTGKLAYHSSKIWEQWDSQFSITQRTGESPAVGAR